MKASNFMIGDWVRIKGLKDPIKRLVCVDEYLGKVDFLDGEELITTSIINVLPIQLTDEILEKNGWEIGTIPDICNGTEDWAIWPVDSEIEIPFRLQRGYDGHRWWIVVGIGGLLTHVDYVHELQHAFRLCGIEKEIKMKSSK